MFLKRRSKKFLIKLTLFFSGIFDALKSLELLLISHLASMDRNPYLSVTPRSYITKKDLEEIKDFIIKKGYLDMYLASRISLSSSK